MGPILPGRQLYVQQQQQQQQQKIEALLNLKDGEKGY
jgi:hypothetical protein